MVGGEVDVDDARRGHPQRPPDEALRPLVPHESLHPVTARRQADLVRDAGARAFEARPDDLFTVQDVGDSNLLHRPLALQTVLDGDVPWDRARQPRTDQEHPDEGDEQRHLPAAPA